MIQAPGLIGIRSITLYYLSICVARARELAFKANALLTHGLPLNTNFLAQNFKPFLPETLHFMSLNLSA